MATEIRVPTLGECVTEATIGQWFKKVGDAIAADEPLVELETDKVTIEVPAPAAGMLEEITAKHGDTVDVGALLGAIAAGGGAAKRAKQPKPKPAAKPKPSRRRPASPARHRPRSRGRAPRSPASRRSHRAQHAAGPVGAKLMAENNVAVDQVDGSGKRGQVLKDDVLDAHRQGRAVAAAPRRRSRAARRRPPRRAPIRAPTTRRAKSGCG